MRLTETDHHLSGEITGCDLTSLGSLPLTETVSAPTFGMPGTSASLSKLYRSIRRGKREWVGVGEREWVRVDEREDECV
jgi:hypothetical protein